MEIQKYLHESFGPLIVIVDTKTGNFFFILKQITDEWGHTNPTQAMKSARLNKDERKVIILSKFPNLKSELTKLNLVTSKTPWITLVSEPGLYKLVLNSKLKKAHQFYDWVVSNVIPSIRKTGNYSISDKIKSSVEIKLDDEFLSVGSVSVF